MKVFEILDPKKFEPTDVKQDARTKYAELSRGSDDYAPQQGIEKLGSGLFGSAHATEEEPGTAHKVVRPAKNLNDDGYYQYMKMLASHVEGSNNRYFPKVYDIEVYKSPNPSLQPDTPYTYKVQMERLQKFSTLSAEELMQIGNNLFSNFEALVSSRNGQRKNLRGEDYVHNKVGFEKRNRAEQEALKIQKQKVLFGAKGEEEYSRSYKDVLENALFDAIKTAMTPDQRSWGRSSGHGPSTNIKDPELKRALIILRGFIKKSRDTGNSREPDIHSGNIMVRRGPFTPQLVFTDPVV
jgi:hypothetical protein